MSQSPNEFAASWAERLLAGDREVASFYAGVPADSFDHAKRRVAEAPVPLGESELAEWTEWLAPFAPRKAMTRNLATLARPDTIVVVTGQQAGFLGGPLYTLYKAAGAIRLARDISRQTGLRCVPLFWVASDDHDFAEVAVHHWLGANGVVRSRAFVESPGDVGKPVSDRTVPQEDLRAFAAEFAESTGDSKFRSDVLGFVERISAGPQTTWESQFVTCLVDWFGDAGLVPVVPRLPFMRRRAAATMRAEIEAQGGTSQRLLEAGMRLDSLGAAGALIHRTGDEANFFLSENGVRSKVRWSNGRAEILHPVTGRKTGDIAKSDLLLRLSASPQDFSPNAALRPVVQDAALPTVAYVGGPSEVVYHAQAGVLHEDFGVFRPIVVPRPSAVLVTSKARRILARWEARISDVGGLDRAQLAKMAAWRADPEKARAQFAKSLAAIRAEIAMIDETIGTHARDTALARASARLRRSLGKGAAKLEAGLDARLAAQDTQVAAELKYLDALLFPGGSRQERTLGALSPLLLEGGPATPLALVDRLDPLEPGTRVLPLDELPGVQLR